MSKHFTLSKVKVLDGLQLALVYADGEAFTIDLASIVKRHKTLAPLRDAAVSPAHPASIAHFKALGVTTLSLLPVHHCLS